MISIGLDLGAVPSVLQALQNPAVPAKAAKAAAESYTSDMHDYINAGSAFTSHTGQLQQSINWIPHADGADVYVNADFAPYVEHGTGTHVGHAPWVIRPKAGRKALKIPVLGGGGYVLRREVIHPGSRAFPFFFADSDHRQANMLAAVRFVVHQAIVNAGGQ